MSPARIKTLPDVPECSDIRDCVADFLSRCKIGYKHAPIDPSFLECCYREAKSRGYVTEDEQLFLQFLPGGAAMALTGYAHLPDMSIRVSIALYTACGIYLDDKFKTDVDAVAKFNERFIRGTPQEDRVLDAFADIILDILHRFPRVSGNMIVSSTLNAVNALLLEYETRNMKVSNNADGYPTFSRIMSGASESYALFVFPHTIPVEDYIQALPELMIFINNGNDILSFFKEEADGESVNRISLLAACRGSTKVEALRCLVNEAVTANDKILKILEPHRDSCNAYGRFSSGFIEFHVTLKRYRLDELEL
ncbi:isoprenoid synthase domain-containing protein [Collybia nuda]|uniref:Isoprenoid synthase domain-containing protein n=1 Tax=Collybia nuda TaxID=64659 RepID=A0A9P5YBJ7_9AGAR|nr:isoprenoid synthase domain-containing protein [Collybia nuda]